MPPANTVRAARARVIGDTSRGGAAFGRALSDVVDAAFVDATGRVELPSRWALVALGSYARRELCPGSDIDVMLLHDGGSAAAAAAELWYPLWDAGFVLGHSMRTVREALALADDDLDALTALLDTRTVGGDATLGAELTTQVRRLAERRRKRVVQELATSAGSRAERPGPVAEILEPNLKDGAGGLRDVQALGWAGWTLGPAGPEALVAQGYLQPDDPQRLAAAKELLLGVRVALHRVTGGRSDVLALQDQDAVAAARGDTDADALVRDVSSAARTVTWIAGDVWSRLLAAQRGPGGRLARRDRAVAPGVILRDGRVTAASDAAVDAGLVLRAAVAAADTGTDLDRATLARFRAEMGEPVWGADEREAFVTLLASGRRAVPAIEALDHVGIFVRLLPEWAHVRSLPQRNAYHRFTVDRHLLEAVAESARLRHEPGLTGDVARRARTDLLVLSALLHDIGKGLPGDHSEVGAAIARTVARRMGLDASGVETLGWIVRNHLLLSQIATRRDLSEETTVTRFGRAVGDAERLDLLFVLTVGDSKATGPAAWNASKAALTRELFVKTEALFERGTVVAPLVTAQRARLAELIGAAETDDFLDAMPAAYATAFPPELLARHRELLDAGELRLEWSDLADGRLECTTVARDRPGLLATVAGVLSLSGFEIQDAAGYSHRDGTAIEVFTGLDRFGRLTDPAGRAGVAATLDEALRGALPLDERLRERARRYRGRHPRAGSDGIRIEIDLEASAVATVVEVHAPDEVGLLARVARVFGDLGLDVSQTLVATLGDRVVDVFYVRDLNGEKVHDATTLARLRDSLTDRLTGELAGT